MKKTAIFYGSTSGNTEAAAKKIAKLLEADIFDVSDNPSKELEEYSNLIFGTSTWGVGDLQDDWENFITQVENANLKNKTIAFFGYGDSASYPDSFVNGIGTIYNAIQDNDCKIVGETETEGYEFDESTAEIDGKFIGLVLDDENQNDLSDSRIESWVSNIKALLN